VTASATTVRESPEYRHLFAVAYRLLGSVHDAEDAAQEGLVRWQALGAGARAEIREPLAWLTRVVGRICLDQLGSARARREAYTGVWLPEPVLGEAVAAGPSAPSPEDAVTLEESVSIALLTAMERLTPAERVALILHDVFAVPFRDVAEIVGRTPEACRQLATAARGHLRARPRFDVAGPERDEVVAAFARACAGGDVEALARVLDPAVVARSDGGDKVHAARRTIEGETAVAHFLLGVLALVARQGRVVETELAPVNGRTGLVVREQGSVIAVVDLAVRGGKVAEVAIIVNPDKL
jgi:RNA polymerase sigma-70 factor, ECF subfamily